MPAFYKFAPLEARGRGMGMGRRIGLASPNVPVHIGPMRGLPFLKMHGLGNDFILLDARRRPLALDSETVRALADRRAGIGCDQLVVLEPPRREGDAFVRFWNSDGEEVSACGNGTRCAARLLMEEAGRDAVVLETRAGLLTCRRVPGGLVAADMGVPFFAWDRIPLARPMDTRALDFGRGGLERPAAVNVGNPHVVFFVDDLDAHDLAALGPEIERDPLFPERVNVSLAQIAGPERVVVGVWERGAGLTRACGTAACAVLAAAARLGLTGRSAEIVLPGGSLFVEWRIDGHLVMTGPAALSFRGETGPDLMGGVLEAPEGRRGAA